MTILGGLLQNASLLLALVLAYSLFIERLPRERPSTHLVQGVLFGLTAVIGMAYPVTIAPGVIFDARSVVIAMAGVFAGVIPTAIATLIAVAFRAWVGGPGALIGVAVLLTAAALGLGFGLRRQAAKLTVNVRTLAALGLLTHLVSILWFLLLPQPVLGQVLHQVALPYLLVLPAVTVLLGLLLRMQEQRNEDARALIESRTRLVEAQRIAGIGDWQWDLDSGRQVGSREQRNIYGGRSVIPPTPFETDNAFYSNATWPSLKAALEAARTEGTPFTCDAQIVRPDASSRWIRIRGEAVRGHSGKIAQLRGTVEDITERKAAADALAHERAFLATLIQTIPDLVWLKDPDGVYLACNRRFEQFFGAPAQEILGRTDRDFMPEQQAAFFRRHDLNALAAGGPTTNEETITFADDGHQELLETIKTPLRDGDGQVIGVLGVGRNIGPQRHAQEALRLERDRVQQILETVDAIIVALDRDGRITLINRTGCETLGYRDDELAGRDWFELALQDVAIADTERAAYQEALATGSEQSRPQTTEVRPRDGGTRTINWRMRLLRDETGRVIGSLSAGQDVTEQEELHHRIEKLAAHVPGVLYQYQQWPDGRAAFPFASRGIKAIYGVEPEEVVDDATPVFEVLHPDDLEPIKESIAMSIARMETWHKRYRVRFRDGRTIWVEGESSPEHQPDGSVLWHGYIRDITDAMQSEQRVLESQHKLLQAQYLARMGDFEWEIATGKVTWSEGMYRLLGYDPSDEVDFNTVNTRIHHPDDVPRVTRWLQDAIDSDIEQLEANEYRLLRKDDSVVDVQVQGWLTRQDGVATKLFGTCLDITERKRSEAQLKLAASVFEHSRDGILITDADNRIVDVNPSFERITGYARAEALGQDPGLLSSGRHDGAFYAAMWNALRSVGFWEGEIWNRRADGEMFAETLSISAVHDGDGAVRNYIGVFSDISQVKAHEAQLDHIAHHDPLTGLPNRRLLTDRLQQALSRRRRGERITAVCYLDLDGFKAINDRHGHEVGDELLINVARALRQDLRDEDTVARLGGDEFVLLLTDLLQPEDCVVFLERILSTIREGDLAGDIAQAVSASIGVALCPPDHADADTLLRHADQAMYRAKEAGKNTYHLYDAEQDRRMQSRQAQRAQLRRAVENGELRLWFQPQVHLLSRQVVRAEALIRWQHPEQGLLLPGEFLPNAEGTELELAIGEWVIDAAIRQQQQWRQQARPLLISINIGANHLLRLDFFSRLMQRFSEHQGASVKGFELEILETAALSDFEQALLVLSDCRAAGLKIALDDFGTGYSSLAYLRRLPVDRIKIDQAFVRDMVDDPGDLEIVQSVIRLAASFNRDVIAEGVETLGHAALLAWLGCHHGQGYGIARPMPAAELPGWIEHWSAQRGWPEAEPGQTRRHPELPALIAAQNHRYWLHHFTAAVALFDRARINELSELDSMFGSWYRGQGVQDLGELPAFRAAGQAHAKVHRLVQALVADKRLAGSNRKLLADPVTQIHTASAGLLHELDRLVEDVRSSGPRGARIEEV